jgi:hypothetical protein
MAVSAAAIAGAGVTGTASATGVRDVAGVRHVAGVRSVVGVRSVARVRSVAGVRHVVAKPAVIARVAHMRLPEAQLPVPAAEPSGRLARSSRVARSGWASAAARPARSAQLSAGGLDLPFDSIYWGAVTGTQFNGDQAPYDMSVVSDFDNEDALGRHMSIVPMYLPFADCSVSPCAPYAFPSGVFTNIRAFGSIPMVSWGSSSLQDGESGTSTDSAFTLADVAKGDFDAYLTAWAQAAKAWGQPFFLRFDWEMNGDWFIWGDATNSNTPAEYVAAWRHVHDIFTKVGATNATWVWCPNVNYAGAPDSNLADFYPGDAYVDWTCLDGYNSASSLSSTQSWDQVAESTYDEITAIAPAKPLMIGEFGSTTAGGTRPLWLTHMLDELPLSYPDVHAIVLYDNLSAYQLEGDPGSQAAFAAAINGPAYSDDNLGSLGAGPIAAP